MTFLYLKAVHIIFIVAWFAGLFYMPRLLIYITEAHAKPEPERSVLLKQLKMMSSRLWLVITWPGALITLVLGVALLVNNPGWLQTDFMKIKLVLVFTLYLYHFSLQYIFGLLKKDIIKYSSLQLRFWNEVATLLLIAIVFIIVLKDALDTLWGIAGLVGIMILLTIAIKAYKKFRNE